MARGPSSLLASPAPCTLTPANVTIGHVQLRDVVICPHDRGIVTYPQDNTILEHDLLAVQSAPRTLARLKFVPNSLSALNLPNSDDTLLAAGGQEAELYLSLFSSTLSRHDGPSRGATHGFGQRQWENAYEIQHGSINNSVLLTSLSLTGSHQSSAEPRLIVSNNDKSVKFFDVAVRRHRSDSGLPRLSDAGQLKLDVPVNHSSISPDGRTLLCVGDSPDVTLHRITGGSRVSVLPIATLSLSPYITAAPYTYWPSTTPTAAIPASFSTSFSADGSKFAVASQEGVVVIWDVRSTKPLKVFQTDKSRPSSKGGNGGASGYISEYPWDWGRMNGNAPGWGVRSVKFSPAGVGREVLTFTEHTSLMHVVDARTFEAEKIIRMPVLDGAPKVNTGSSHPRSRSPPLPRGLEIPSADILPSPPRIVLVSEAVENAFRIPTSSSRRPRIGRRYRSREDLSAEEDAENLVVIPPMGDSQVENDVRQLLGRHGLRTRSALDTAIYGLDREELRDDLLGDRENEEEMDVDELEYDCLSRTPSRSSSPSPMLASARPSPSEHSSTTLSTRPNLLSRRESAGPYALRRSVGSTARRHRRSALADVAEDVDIAGTCFDPTGTYVYVASVKGIGEWKVRGAEQRWWTDPAWA